VTYTDAHVTLTGLLIVCAALIFGAAIAAVNAVRMPRGCAGRCDSAGCGLLYRLQGVSWYVSSFIVKPNELVREQP